MLARRILGIFCAGLILCCSACVSARHSKVQKIEWADAVAMIREGKIESVFQAHSLKVGMTGKDGVEYATTQPAIDVVWRLVQEVDPTGAKIKFGTE
jgi:hypothetical protein